MTKSKQDIIDEITAHIQKSKASYSNWYVGISEDAKKRMFQDHNVNEKNAWWIWKLTSSSDVAREIEDHFVNTLGTDGGLGGGDEYSDQVYAYKKGSYTNP